VGCNNGKPHVHVLPEDDANARIATGLQLELGKQWRQMNVLPVADGWTKVLEQFERIHVPALYSNPQRFIILLIDFDGHVDRINVARARIPQDLADRAFVLGVLTEPEDLKRTLGSYEAIGRKMARDCNEGTIGVWDHDLLRHNAPEIERLQARIRPILFET
jgi:hypothetical protein